MADVKLTAVIEAKDKLSKTLQNASDKFKKFGKNIQNETKQIEKTTSVSTKKIASDWMALSAKLVAIGYTIHQSLSNAFDYASFEQSITTLATRVKAQGGDIIKVMQDVRKASAGMIDTKALAETINKAISLGIPINKIAKLMEIARIKAREMGTDVTSAFNDIVVGIGRNSPMILDNLGIVVKLGEAYEEYAKKLGKTSEELTAFEQKQAILDYVLKVGEKSLKLYGDTTLTTAEQIQIMKAQLKDMGLHIGRVLIPVLNNLLLIWQKIRPAVDKVIEGWAYMVSAIEHFISLIQEEWDSYVANLKAGVKKLGVVFSEFWNWVKNKFKGGVSGLVDAIESKWNEIDKTFGKSTQKFGTAWKKAFNDFKKDVADIKRFFATGIPTKATKVKVGKVIKTEVEGEGIVDEKTKNAIKQLEKMLLDATLTPVEKSMYIWEEWKNKVIEKAKEAGVYTKEFEISITKLAEMKKAEIKQKYLEEQEKKELESQYRIAQTTMEIQKQILEAKMRMGEIDYTTYLKEKIKIIKTQIAILKERMKDLTGDEFIRMSEKIAKLEAELNSTSKTFSGTFVEGIKAGLLAVSQQFGTVFENAKQLAMETAISMKNTMGDFFFDAITGKLKTFSDYVRSFFMSLARALSDFLAKLAMQKWILPFFTGLFAHTGGYIGYDRQLKYHNGGEVKKYHDGGLASDEVPAILQIGEGVLSREGMKMLGALNRGILPKASNPNMINININAVDAKSFEDLANRNPSAIIMPVMRALRMNSSLRYEIRGG